MWIIEDTVLQTDQQKTQHVFSVDFRRYFNRVWRPPPSKKKVREIENTDPDWF